MPVLVGAFLNEMHGLLRARLRVTPVSKLPAMRAQLGSKGALVPCQILRCLPVANAKLLDGLAGTRLGGSARLLDRLSQDPSGDRELSRSFRFALVHKHGAVAHRASMRVAAWRWTQASTSAASRSVLRSNVTV